MPLRRRLESLEHIVFNTSERTYMTIAFAIAGPENSVQLSYTERYTNEYNSWSTMKGSAHTHGLVKPLPSFR